MKRATLLLVLAMASTTGTLLAQNVISQPFPTSGSRTEQLFNSPKPGTLRSSFDFYLLNGNRLNIEVNHVGQLQNLHNLDSLLKQVGKALQPFSDSFAKPLVSRRIDYYQTAVDTRLRFLEYPQKGELYRIKGSDTTQLKIEQDTLRIRLFSLRDILINKEKRSIEQSFFVTLYLNAITDLPSIQPSDMEWALNTLKADLGANLYGSEIQQSHRRYYAAYNVVEQKKLIPSNTQMRSYGRRTSFTPYTQVAIQYVRGAWAPSIGLGFEIKRNVYTSQTQQFRLLWEPLFFFRNEASGKVRMDRNDFVTFKYTYNIMTNTKELRFATNVSLGYLVNREGPWLERNTFKFTLPGLQTKNILLEPEFYFNDFFRHFSPSLKLTLVFE